MHAFAESGFHTLRSGLFVCTLILSGCGKNGPDLAGVEGTVRLDGKPLPNAEVVFQPERGSPSMGRTDDGGRYVLKYSADKEGALVGKHKVSVSTYLEGDEDADDPALRENRPEQVPDTWNLNTQQTREVEPGTNTIDLEIDSSEGSIIQPTDEFFERRENPDDDC